MWEDLNLKQKAAIVAEANQQGITNINNIARLYNKQIKNNTFAKGGEIKNILFTGDDIDPESSIFDALTKAKVRFKTGNPSGYRTKAQNARFPSGEKSQHRRLRKDGKTAYALDIVPDFEKGATWETLMAELTHPALQKYFAANSIGVLNETIASTKKKTGATGDHFHVGYTGNPDGTMARTYASWVKKYYKDKPINIPGYTNDGLTLQDRIKPIEKAVNPMSNLAVNVLNNNKYRIPLSYNPATSIISSNISQDINDTTDYDNGLSEYAKNIERGRKEFLKSLLLSTFEKEDDNIPQFTLGYPEISADEIIYPNIGKDGGKISNQNNGKYTDDFMRQYSLDWTPFSQLYSGDPYYSKIKEHELATSNGKEGRYATNAEGRYVPVSELNKLWNDYLLTQPQVNNKEELEVAKAQQHRQNQEFNRQVDNFFTGNWLFPSQFVGAAARGITGDDRGFWNNWLLGNTGVVTDNFAQEHPYWSTAANLAFDVLGPNVKGLTNAIGKGINTYNWSNFNRTQKVLDDALREARQGGLWNSDKWGNWEIPEGTIDVTPPLQNFSWAAAIRRKWPTVQEDAEYLSNPVLRRLFIERSEKIRNKTATPEERRFVDQMKKLIIIKKASRPVGDEVKQVSLDYYNSDRYKNRVKKALGNEYIADSFIKDANNTIKNTPITVNPNHPTFVLRPDAVGVTYSTGVNPVTGNPIPAIALNIGGADQSIINHEINHAVDIANPLAIQHNAQFPLAENGPSPFMQNGKPYYLDDIESRTRAIALDMFLAKHPEYTIDDAYKSWYDNFHTDLNFNDMPIDAREFITHYDENTGRNYFDNFFGFNSSIEKIGNSSVANLNNFITNDVIPRMRAAGHSNVPLNFTPRFIDISEDPLSKIKDMSNAGAWYTPAINAVTLRGPLEAQNFGLLAHETAGHNLRQVVAPNYNPMPIELFNRYIESMSGGAPLTEQEKQLVLQTKLPPQGQYNDLESQILEEAYPWIKNYLDSNGKPLTPVKLLHERGAVNTQLRANLSEAGKIVGEDLTKKILDTPDEQILDALLQQRYTSSIGNEIARLTGEDPITIQLGRRYSDLSRWLKNKEIADAVKKVKGAMIKVGSLAAPVAVGTVASNQKALGGNLYSEGGGYQDWVKRMESYKGIPMNNLSDYMYNDFYFSNPPRAWAMLGQDPRAHFIDEFKTVYHPTFSIDSRASGKYDPRYNPFGYTGGRWEDSTFYAPQFSPVSMDERINYLVNAEEQGARLKDYNGEPIWLDDGSIFGPILPNITITNGTKKNKK